MQQPVWSDFPTTPVEFDERFGSEEACYAYLTRQRWPDGFRCPACGHGEAWSLARRRLLQCTRCSRQVSLTAGTIFHRSRKPLGLWFKAIFLMTGQTRGISARNLRRQLGLGSYQTAWTWQHKLRRALRPEREPLVGPVEVDDSHLLRPFVREGKGRRDQAGPLVSVITPSFNQGAYIEACLKSVSTQTYPHVEHLVIDGGSGDTTLELLRRHEGRYNLRWLSEPDRGQADAINKGLDLARGEIVCWLNSDDLFFNHTVLTRVVEVFRVNSAVDVVVGDGYRCDREGRFLGPIVLDPESLNLRRMRLADFVLQPSVFWKRNHMRLDESYHYAFDWLFFLGMFEASLNVFYLREYCSVYRTHGVNKTARDNAARKGELFRIARRNLGWRDPSTLWCGLVYAGYRLAEASGLDLLKRLVRRANFIMIRLTRYRIASG